MRKRIGVRHEFTVHLLSWYADSLRMNNKEQCRG